MTKKLVSLVLIICMFIIPLNTKTNVSAHNSDLVSIDITPENINIDEISNKLEKITLTNGDIVYGYYQYNNNENIVLILDENKKLIQKAVADKSNNTITETVYSNKQRSDIIISEKKYNISELISNMEENSLSTEPLENNNNDTKASLPSYNYISNEPLFDTNLTQWSDGYYYIGSSKSSTLPYTAYLFRNQSVFHSSSKTYSFSKGTTLATVVSVVGLVLTGITVASVSFLLGSILVGAVVDYNCSPEMGIKNIHNFYRSRVGSNYTLRYGCCKRFNYWYSKVWDKKTNDYRDSYDYKNFEHGYPSSIDMINIEGINCQAQGIVIQRPCA